MQKQTFSYVFEEMRYSDAFEEMRYSQSAVIHLLQNAAITGGCLRLL